jgi:hypothetical protein
VREGMMETGKTKTEENDGRINRQKKTKGKQEKGSGRRKKTRGRKKAGRRKKRWEIKAEI